jgi:hypothetical protein
LTFDRSRLPDPVAYFEGEGLSLTGPGKWKTAECTFHGGGDSLRINTEGGGWVCMSCGVKGGDVLSYHMQRHGLEFVDACKAIGAWVDDGRQGSARQAPLPFSARAALEVIRFESLLCAVAACNLAKGIELASADRERLVQAAARIELIASEIAK